MILSLHPDAHVLELGSGLVELVREGSSCVLQSEALAQLSAEGVQPQGKFAGLLEKLGDGGFLCRTVMGGGRAVARLVPTTPHFRWTAPRIDPALRYRLSRFAFMRRDGDQMVLETPLEPARLELKQPLATALLACLNEPMRLGELSVLDEESTRQLLELLLGMRAVTTVRDDGSCPEEDQIPSTWEFHDLLEHAQSRMRMTTMFVTFGANYRFGERIYPPQLPSPVPDSLPLALPRPTLGDDGFTRVLESRRSLRNFGQGELPLKQLAELLYRVCHPIDHAELEDVGYLRPYPCGGGMYPQIYVLAYRCADLEPGMYYYDQDLHQLHAMPTSWSQVDPLYRDIRATLAGNGPPAALMVAARFAEVAMKYESMSYSLQLKNCGALLQTVCLVAAAMGMAACPLGSTNADHFARATGLNYYRYGSIGELALGLPENGGGV